MKRTRGKKGRIMGRIMDKKALSEIRELLSNESRERDMLIEHLHKIQDKYHFISNSHILALAMEMNIPMAEVYETATFYHHFDVIKEGQSPPPPLTVRVCNSLTCEMFGANDLISELVASTIPRVRIQNVPCVGRCHAAPMAIVGTHPVDHADLHKIMAAISNKKFSADYPDCIPYREYIKAGGYNTLNECLRGNYTRDHIIKILEDSNLRGLGGAGFPVGKKWRILHGMPKPRHIAINIDEGEPGTFKDRYYLEHDPHRFIEGTLIAHWAIEADAIYIYLRDEYAGCRKMLQRELAELQKNPPCSLPPIHLRRGAGAYICGEESAMIESIEGKRGMPRLRPPYIAQVGLFGQPTLEQNMESMHWIREIVEKGPQWFAVHGRHGRKGLRSFP